MTLAKAIEKTGTFTLILAFIVVFVGVMYDNSYLTASMILPFTSKDELIKFMIMFGYLIWFIFLYFLDR